MLLLKCRRLDPRTFNVCTKSIAPPVDAISRSRVIFSQEERIVDGQCSEMVWREDLRVDILLLKGVGQCLYHDSQPLLALCFGALEIKKASIHEDTSGVEAVVAESPHCTIEDLAEGLALALAPVSFSLGPYSMKKLIVYVWHGLHTHIDKLDQCKLLQTLIWLESSQAALRGEACRERFELAPVWGTTLCRYSWEPSFTPTLLI